MKRFEILQVTCEGCGTRQEPKRYPGTCSSCMNEKFRVEIERAASGLESLELEDFIRGANSDGPAEPFWSTQNFLTCAGVSGDEIALFCAAPIEARRRIYVAWKRRELEASLNPGQAVCGRCGVIFKAYENEWNRAGYCSRSCGNAAKKSKKAVR